MTVRARLLGRDPHAGIGIDKQQRRTRSSVLRFVLGKARITNSGESRKAEGRALRYGSTLGNIGVAAGLPPGDD